MINVFRVSHFAYDLRNPEVMEAFKKDSELELDRYYLTEEDRAPIRAKDLQPLLDAGVNSNVLRSLSQALDLPPIVLATRAPRRSIFDADKKDLTPEEAHWRSRVEEIQAELRLVERIDRR